MTGFIISLPIDTTHGYVHVPWRIVIDVYLIYWNLVLDLDLYLVKSTLIQIDIHWYVPWSGKFMSFEIPKASHRSIDPDIGRIGVS